MHRMTVELISLRSLGTQVVAQARAKTADDRARVWLEITFRPAGEPWAEAYDRVLDLLDIA